MRTPWDQYFLEIAKTVATRSTCDRKHVGAVIVRDRTILSTGYNGSIGGLPHCDDVGHDMVDGHCDRTVHAEANAILQAAKNGVRIDEATLYVTASPCWPCFKLIANAGIQRVVYAEFYREPRILSVAMERGILLEVYPPPRPTAAGGCRTCKHQFFPGNVVARALEGATGCRRIDAKDPPLQAWQAVYHWHEKQQLPWLADGCPGYEPKENK